MPCKIKPHSFGAGKQQKYSEQPKQEKQELKGFRKGMEDKLKNKLKEKENGNGNKKRL